VSNQQLWAPWRLGYILGEKTLDQPCNLRDLLGGADPECFLCHAAPTGDDRSRLIVDRGVHTVTLLNRYPYNNGHLLVAPHRHLARLDELENDLQLEVSQTVARMVTVLEKALQPQGFNIGVNLGRAAGAGVPGHLHWHIVPRWVGDTNFMPVLGETKVISEHLHETYRKLREKVHEKLF
jgi:ATP adenylyltransferase